jgi:P4 family phage/plasmid primase-like protien
MTDLSQLRLDNLPDEPLAWALAYAGVFEVVPFGFDSRAKKRKPLTAHGIKDATRDPAQIQLWWGKNPGADIGVIVPADLVVLDLDAKKGKNGRRDFKKVTGLAVDSLDTPLATSPTGGVHVWCRANGVRYTAEVEIDGLGIDFCANGKDGRCAIAPSPHTGRAWVKPLTGPVMEAPPFFANWMRQKEAQRASARATAGAQQPSQQGRTSPRAAKALHRACKALSEAGPGERDSAVTKHVLRIGSLAAAGEIDPVTALDALITAANANPGAAPDYADKVRRAFGAGQKQPTAPQPDLEPLDDVIADTFAAGHAQDLRYVAAWNKWFEWRDGCWREEKTLRVFDLIRKTCKAHGIERAGMARTVGAAYTLARTDRRIAAAAGQWDAYPMALNTPAGIVDLKTGDIYPHDPRAYCTKITAAAPKGGCPQFKAFLAVIMQGEEATISYLQRVLGYCLTGDVSEEVLFFFYGLGANGKGVLMSTVADILGEYHKAAAIETFTETRNDRHPTELARLAGARLVSASETEAGRHWAESRLKMLTGRDTITAHFMRQDDFEYRPQFKLIVSGNHKPNLRNVGEAMRRRLQLLPFAVTIAKIARDRKLRDKLKAEWPGILQWMIEGCLEWQKHGLDPPAEVRRATDAYFATQNTFSTWFEEKCTLDLVAWTKTTVLFESWKEWAERANVRIGNIKEFGELMETQPVMWEHRVAGNGYRGVRL